MNKKPWFEITLKVIIIGDPSVGKTSLQTRIIEDVFKPKYSTTLGVDFSFKEINVKGSKVKLQIWDTAGQEKYRSLITTYYRHTDGIIMVFDLSDENSFENLIESWIPHVSTYIVEDVPKILILGNKKDLMVDSDCGPAAEALKRRLESHPLCIMRDLELNTPILFGETVEDVDFNINGSKGPMALGTVEETGVRTALAKGGQLKPDASDQKELLRRLEDKTQQHVIFDYIYKEVSAQSGESVSEAIQEFGEVLYDVYKDKKTRKKVESRESRPFAGRFSVEPA